MSYDIRRLIFEESTYCLCLFFMMLFFNDKYIHTARRIIALISLDQYAKTLGIWCVQQLELRNRLCHQRLGNFITFVTNGLRELNK